MFCIKCGKKIDDKVKFCDFCGQKTAISRKTTVQDIPDEIRGWSWGGFLLSWIWAIGNKTWIGLLSLIPYAGFIMSIILGVKGREWAWKNKHWESIDQFKRVQKNWAVWGLVMLLIIPILGIISTIIISAINPIEQVNRARDAGSKSDALQILAASEIFKADNNHYPWNKTNSTKDYISNDISKESWIKSLVSSDGISQDLINKLNENDIKLMLIQTENADESVYVCFRPLSSTVKNEAQQGCVSENTFANKQSQLLCQTGNEYLCLP